jgi:hypothetical protein
MEQNTELTIENAESVAIAPPTMSPEELASAMEKSEKLDKCKVLMDLTASYLELEKVGETFRGIFIGFQDMNITDKTTGEIKKLKAARFLADRKVQINAGAVLVSEIHRANVPVNTPLEVTYTEKRNNTKIYTIKLLA